MHIGGSGMERPPPGAGSAESCVGIWGGPSFNTLAGSLASGGACADQLNVLDRRSGAWLRACVVWRELPYSPPPSCSRSGLGSVGAPRSSRSSTPCCCGRCPIPTPTDSSGCSRTPHRTSGRCLWSTFRLSKHSRPASRRSPRMPWAIKPSRTARWSSPFLCGS